MKGNLKSVTSLPLALQVLLPILITILCGGILLLCAIRPYELAKTYLRIAFMDGSASITTDGTSGLHVVEADINTEYTGETAEEGKVIVPTYGSQCAILEAASIDLYVPVYWGGGSELLELGACQTPSSAPIGNSGNSVISAHVNTFFSNLTDLTAGDTVTLYTTYGKFTYTVKEPIEFDASDEYYLKEKEDDRLTLYTCEMQLLGSSSARVGVICELTEKAFYQSEEDAS